jgi:hypothetical protein
MIRMFVLLLLGVIAACSWNYRFDADNNHFNVVYPDKNAVYYGMIIQQGIGTVHIENEHGHPIADYFSIQVYDSSDLVNSIYHFNDETILSLDELTRPRTGYKLTLELDTNSSYFVLFRIYGSRLPLVDATHPNVYYWAGPPPTTYLGNNRIPLCNIDYSQQSNIYSNITRHIYPTTNTVCIKNNVFLFMNVPAGSLANADANYMIACIDPGVLYKITIKVPVLMCSLGFSGHPYINEAYDMRYMSLSIVSTTAPRPTVSTYQIPCDVSEYSVEVLVDAAISKPGLLYRQLLPNPDFPYSIAKAKKKCYIYANKTYDDFCILSVMDQYYPVIQRRSND